MLNKNLMYANVFLLPCDVDFIVNLFLDNETRHFNDEYFEFIQ
jgi:hypothetical protein